MRKVAKTTGTFNHQTFTVEFLYFWVKVLSKMYRTFIIWKTFTRYRTKGPGFDSHDFGHWSWVHLVGSLPVPRLRLRHSRTFLPDYWGRFRCSNNQTASTVFVPIDEGAHEYYCTFSARRWRSGLFAVVFLAVEKRSILV